MARYSEWNPKAMATCCGIFGFIIGVAGIIWHGMLGQPTLVLEAGSLSNPSIALGTLIAFAIIGYVSGYIWALVYNWALKRK